MKNKDELAEEHLLEELRKAPARMHQHLMTDFKAGYDAATKELSLLEEDAELLTSLKRKLTLNQRT